jgi:hypothetical protein
MIDIPDYDDADAVCRALVRAYAKQKKVWPPQDLAEFMTDMHKIIERARRIVETVR